MEIYDIAETGRMAPERYYTLGEADLGPSACYLTYAEIGPEMAPRRLTPGPGHEEIVYVVSGSLKIEGEAAVVEAGQAFYLRGEERCLVRAEGIQPATYIIAGAHSLGLRHRHP